MDKFIEGAATAGTVKAAGLPNITGHLLDYRANDSAGHNQFDGAFIASTDIRFAYAPQTTTTGTYGFFRDSFSAQKSNSIYGNSSTVQPPALTMRYAIYTGIVGKHCWLRTA